MASKYIDMTAITQVIGCVYNRPELLDITDKYHITDEDFTDQFHKIIFGAIYKIHELGAKQITLNNICSINKSDSVTKVLSALTLTLENLFFFIDSYTSLLYLGILQYIIADTKLLHDGKHTNTATTVSKFSFVLVIIYPIKNIANLVFSYVSES